jgi:hypothetical protein
VNPPSAPSERERIRFLRRIMTMFLLAVVGVAIAVIVLVLAYATTSLTRTIRDELREHEAQNLEARRELRVFIRTQGDQTRKEVARFRARIAQLENFIIKKGFEPPPNGSELTSAKPLPAPGETPPPGKEMPASPSPAPPHPTPGPGAPGPGPEPPGPTPSPTVTCIPIPGPLPDFCFNPPPSP